MNTRLITTMTATALAAGTLVGAAGAAAAPAPRPSTRLVGDCVHAQYEPRTVTIACGDGGIFFKDLRWTSWTRTRATATGQLWVNTDDPDAAAGHYDVQTVHVTFDRPTRVHGQERFSRAVVPYRHKGVTAHEYLYPPTTRLG